MKYGFQEQNTAKIAALLTTSIIFGHASQTFQRKILKKQYEISIALAGRSIAPSQLLHRGMPAIRADTDIKIPDCF